MQKIRPVTFFGGRQDFCSIRLSVNTTRSDSFQSSDESSTSLDHDSLATSQAHDSFLSRLFHTLSKRCHFFVLGPATPSSTSHLSQLPCRRHLRAQRHVVLPTRPCCPKTTDQEIEALPAISTVGICPGLSLVMQNVLHRLVTKAA